MEASNAPPGTAPASHNGPLKGFAVVDGQMRIRFADARANALLGLAGNGMSGSNLMDCLHADYRAYVTSEILLALSSAKETVARSVVVPPDASGASVDFEFRKLDGDDEAVLAHIAPSTPALAAQSRTHRVDDGHSLYWELVESVPVAMAVLDPETAKVIRFNRRFTEIMGVQENNAFDSDVARWVPDFVPGTFEARMQRALTEGEFGLERPLYRADGSTFFARLRMRAFELDGKPRVMLIAADISDEVAGRTQLVELMQSTASLRGDAAFANLVERLAALLKPTALAVLERPHDGAVCIPRVIAVHEAFADPADYVFDAQALELLAGEDSMVSGEVVAALLKRVPALAQAGAESCVSVPLQSDDEVIGYLVCLNQRELFDFERARAMLSICAPLVAAELMHERQTEVMDDINQQMQHAQRLESLGLLAGGIAHDFNNLLTAMMGHTDLARLHARPGSESEHYLSQISRSAVRAAELCSQMLAYAGKGQHVDEDVALNAVVRDIGELLEVSIPNAARLRAQLGDDLPLIRGDRAQLTQVLMNLITNAADAMPDEGGEIVVRTGELDWHGQLAQTNVVGMLAPGRYVVLEVSDNGTGIAPDLKQRIFDPFFSTKERGRGLGLATVFGIVRGHRGGLLLQSTPGHGSSFKVLLPALVSSAAKVESHGLAAGRLERLASLAGKSSGKALVIDDEPLVRGTICAYLHHLGFETEQAIDGVDGLDQLAQDDYDLILLDLTMPRLGGASTLARIRALPSRVPVIMMSGFASATIQAELLRSPNTQLLHKPFSLGDLDRATEAVRSPPDSS